MDSSASSSRHQVTITLGRSGQVVKRQAISDTGNDDEVPLSGRKRSVRERLGSNVVDSDWYGTGSHQGNKRQQRENKSSQHGDDECRVGRDDLRLKLMRKGLSQRSNGGAEQNEVDLREKLSRNSKSVKRYDSRGHIPELRSRYGAREKVPESRSRYGLRERVPESRASTHVSQMPSARSADDLFQLESSRKSYTSWTADGLRHWSPEQLTSVRRDVSPSRTYDQLRSRSSIRSVGTERASSIITRDAPSTLRTQPYPKRSTISVDIVQPSNGVKPSGTALPPAPVMTEVPHTVAELLDSLGLEKYVVLFQAEEVDMAALSQMKESDLKEMGVPMGPRKKILLAVAPYSKQQKR